MKQSTIILHILFILLASNSSHSQLLVPKNGPQDNSEPIYAFKNAVIYLDAETKIEKATLIIQGDKILEVGKSIIIKKGMIVKECEGLTILPSFIDLNSSYGIEPEKRAPWKPGSQMESKKSDSYYWNQSITPEFESSHSVKINEKERLQLLQSGFGIVNTHQQNGIARGMSACVSLTNVESQLIFKEKGSQQFSFKKGTSRQSYPSSQMGSIALIRQFYEDSKWYKINHSENNISLNAQTKNESFPVIFETNGKLEILRADQLGDSFDLQYIISGSGDEYQRLTEIKETNAPLIIPINFPKAIEITNPYDFDHVPLSKIKHWELAPSNPYFLERQEIPFAITSAGHKDNKSFLSHLRKAIKRGLSVRIALHSLTKYPATLLNLDKEIGSLAKGKKANFIIVSKDLFHDEDAKIMENWVLGKENVLSRAPSEDISGTYSIRFNEEVYKASISKSGPQYKGKLNYVRTTIDSLANLKKVDTISTPLSIKINRHQISLSFHIKNENHNGIVMIGGTFEPKFGIMDGDGIDDLGKEFIWSATKHSTKKKKTTPKKSSVHDLDTLQQNQIWFPNMAYGFDSIPQAKTYIIRNATIWTNEVQGIVQKTDLMIQGGKITKLGTLNGSIPKDAIIIDAKGKHVTSGIIDEHSHIAISKGVNESGQAITAEVSIEDVVNSFDIDIYRQLAGGVTTSQLLHGSANPIGGQSALIKLKWGSSPKEMLFPNAPKFIKFALGENVKQTNWGDFNTTRFPQTRMGVEQVFYDAFKRAQVYKEQHQAYNKLSEKKKSKVNKPQVDKELEIIVEILDSKRFVTCHSYIQSEINMLMNVADSMNFTLNTFTHILEGYKVADKMKEHGAGGSTFADWWAYKYEVNDAIPYNASMLNAMGIITAINSDDAEMGRRLNQEAGKIVKYGTTSQEDAWKMVTLNPAKLLHIDDKVGSIKIGKDADIVIWSDNPLSINAKVEQTFVDGILLFDLKNQQILEDRNRKEKIRIMAKMSKDKGEKIPHVAKKKAHYHCDTIEQL